MHKQTPHQTFVSQMENKSKQNINPFAPGTLWPIVVDRTKQAIQSGALLPIETEQLIIEQYGVNFIVRRVSSLKRKNEAKKKTAKTNKAPANPFLPYEKDLFVTDISDTHVCLFNKFNVLDYHLLIVTREFGDQETLITLRDFEALWKCMAEFDSLGFYNGGEVAGASQRHKHLQIVPLPLTPDEPQVPIDTLINQLDNRTSINPIPEFQFSHAFARLPDSITTDPQLAAELTVGYYHAMLKALGIPGKTSSGRIIQSCPYNLLVTRRWMLLVPRAKEFFDSISVNGLGFAGSFFIRNEQQLQTIKDAGPVTVLRNVACKS